MNTNANTKTKTKIICSKKIDEIIEKINTLEIRVIKWIQENQVTGKYFKYLPINSFLILDNRKISFKIITLHDLKNEYSKTFEFQDETKVPIPFLLANLFIKQGFGCQVFYFQENYLNLSRNKNDTSSFFLNDIYRKRGRNYIIDQETKKLSSKLEKDTLQLWENFKQFGNLTLDHQCLVCINNMKNINNNNNNNNNNEEDNFVDEYDIDGHESWFVVKIDKIIDYLSDNWRNQKYEIQTTINGTDFLKEIIENKKEKKEIFHIEKKQKK